MEKLKLGVLGTSEIAFNRFLPALQKSEHFTYVGIASRDIAKTEKFIKLYGGKGFVNYDQLVKSDEVDALYIPLPPALHYEWAKRALEYGKHVLLEKPSTISLQECQDLISLAKRTGSLALQENYMFQYHSQLSYIKKQIEEKKIGDLRLVRIAFGFPKRAGGDFRYNKKLGGGALLDCGGYAIKLASLLLGARIKAVTSSLNYTGESEVDLYGSATLQNEKGLVAQISFGMDNSYKCELEVWGSNGNIRAPRIFTAPVGFKPDLFIQINNDNSIITLPADDQFLSSIEHFYQCIINKEEKKSAYDELLMQSELMNEILDISHKKIVYIE